MKYVCSIVKTSKYAVSIGGDSAEIVERPLGGLSALVVDGQGSGKAAKTLSAALAGKASGLITDGIRDGAVARAVHDWLFAQKHGRVSASISIISAAADTGTMVITRCGNCPVFVLTPGGVLDFSAPVAPLGFYRFTRPQVDQVALEEGVLAVTFSDGVLGAGRGARNMEPEAWMEEIARWYKEGMGVQALAEKILGRALVLDDNRPRDDMTVLVLGMVREPTDGIRRLQVEYPAR